MDFYDVLKQDFAYAFELPECEDLGLYEGALSGEEYEKAVRKLQREEKKKENRLRIAWAGIVIYMVIFLCLYVYSLVSLSTRFIPVNPIFYVVMTILPLGLWAYSTLYDYYNFHNRKFFWFYAAILNLGLNFSYAVYAVSANALLPLFAKLPVNEMISIRANMALARIVLFVLSMIPVVVVVVVIQKQKDDEVFRQTIIGFKLAKEIELEKENPYAYNMKIVKNLVTAEEYTVKEKDRFLHSTANGTTGTGKTSTCQTVALEGDLYKRQENLSYLMKRTEELLREGKIRMKKPMKDVEFSLDNFEAIEGMDEKLSFIDYTHNFMDKLQGKTVHKNAKEELEWLKENVRVAGITAMAPNETFCDEIYELSRKRGVRKVNRVDPVLGKDGKLKPGFIGFNPLKLNPNLSSMDKVKTICQNAVMFADVCQAIFDASGSSDPYFASVNKNITVTASMTAMLVHPYLPRSKGKQPHAGTVQYLINDFKRMKEYRDKLVDLYAEKDKNGRVKLIDGKPNMGPFQSLLDKIETDFLGENSKEMFKQAGGLRIIIDTFLNNPLIRNVLCAEKSIDLDEALEKGEITLVNYALELGSDGKALGLFFLLSYIQAVLRRKGNEKTRCPHFAYIDELPVILHPQVESCFSLFRQYRVAMFVAIQSLSQLEKVQTTRFLKTVLLQNCAHHFVFGRSGPEEMEYYQQIGGMDFKKVFQRGVKETAITADNPSIMYDNRETVERDFNFYGADIRNRDFQEIFVVTVKDGSPMDCFFGKVSFLPESKRIAKATFYVNWKKYYHGTWFDEEEPKTEQKPIRESSTKQFRQGKGQDIFRGEGSQGMVEEMAEESVAVALEEPQNVEEYEEETLYDDVVDNSFDGFSI